MKCKPETAACLTMHSGAHLPHPTWPQMRQIHRLVLVPQVLQRLVLVLLLSMQYRHTGQDVSPQCLMHSP